MANETKIECPCGCGQKVTIAFKEFKDTDAVVQACDLKRQQGIVSYTVAKSSLLKWSGTGFTLHKDALIEVRL